MNANNRTNVRLLAAVIGASAVVTVAAVATAIAQEQAVPATVAISGMTMGPTSTQQTPPSVPDTTVAVPLVKAKPYGG